MRTTLNIADDVLFAAKENGALEPAELGRCASEVARRPLPPAQAPVGLVRLGIQPLPHRGGMVSNALIDRLRGNGID